MRDVSGNFDDVVLCSHPCLREAFRISLAEDEDSMTLCSGCLRLHLQWSCLSSLKINHDLHDVRVGSP